MTLFHISEELDAGDCIAQREIPIEPDDTANDSYEKTIPIYWEMIEQCLPLFDSDTAPRTPQDHARATYACARAPDDGRIDWTQSTAAIYNLIRALSGRARITAQPTA